MYARQSRSDWNSTQQSLSGRGLPYAPVDWQVILVEDGDIKVPWLVCILLVTRHLVQEHKSLSQQVQKDDDLS